MVDIERAITRFGGAFDGAAGPIRSVTSRTCDVLPAIARIAELLYPGTDWMQRTTRLVLRLELGIPSEAVDLARQCGKSLSRGDYLRLTQAQLVDPDALLSASNEALLSCVGYDKTKVGVARAGAEAHKEAAKRLQSSLPALAPYKP